MEGQFYRRFKTTRHPHTNMAKAALNMMTRTSATDYYGDGIHMNSVDTGWITDEDPVEIAARKEVGAALQPAARQRRRRRAHRRSDHRAVQHRQTRLGPVPEGLPADRLVDWSFVKKPVAHQACRRRSRDCRFRSSVHAVARRRPHRGLHGRASAPRAWTLAARARICTERAAAGLAPGCRNCRPDLFRQIFSRAMESLNSPHCRLDSAGAARRVRSRRRRSADAGSVARRGRAPPASTDATRRLVCLVHRRISEPGGVRQVYLALFDAPDDRTVPAADRPRRRMRSRRSCSSQGRDPTSTAGCRSA